MLDRINNWKSDWNFLSATKAQRYTALVMSGIAAFLWAIRGWDSGITTYGTSLHYSVFVIYGLEYAALNWWMDTARKIKGIRNLIISVLWTVFSVAIFEWYWGIGYALQHGETWVLTPLNTVYTELWVITIIGALGGLYSMKLGGGIMVDRLTFFLLSPVIFWLLIGFPQTCYPDVDGTVIYIENNLVHLYNVLAKLGFAFATARVLMHETKHERIAQLNWMLQLMLGSLCALIWGLCTLGLRPINGNLNRSLSFSLDAGKSHKNCSPRSKTFQRLNLRVFTTPIANRLLER